MTPTDEKRIRAVNEAVGEFAGTFFETGAVKQFFDEWEPEGATGFYTGDGELKEYDQANEVERTKLHAEHVAALVRLAEAVKQARTRYFLIANEAAKPFAS